MKIYIVTTSEQQYDDQYYHFDLVTSAGNIDFVHINLEKTIIYAKTRIKDLYEEFEDDLDAVEWTNYTDKRYCELSDQDKLDLLRKISHATLKIHVYKCELNDKDEAVFNLNKRLVINPDTQEPETLQERKWW